MNQKINKVLYALVVFSIITIAVIVGYHTGYTNSTNNIDNYYECAGYTPWKVEQEGLSRVCKTVDGKKFFEPMEPR